MERTGNMPDSARGIEVSSRCQGAVETTLVRIINQEAAKRLSKAQGEYWTLQHPCLPELDPEERMRMAEFTAGEIRRMLPREGAVLVVGLGNRHLKAQERRTLRPVSAMAPGVLGITGVETAEMVRGVVERVQPQAVIAVDALAAMETKRICTTIQVTDTGIQPGSGVGNHRAGLTRETLGVPVIAVGIPMVVYASTIVRDALKDILAQGSTEDAAEAMAERLSKGALGEMVVTPRSIDELVAHLADTLALAINIALQPSFTARELSFRLH